MSYKPITIISGYFGSGKSEFALNYALDIRKKTSKEIDLVDLDIINPYFRTRSMNDFLSNYNIKILGSILEDAPMADIPQVSPNMLSPIHNQTIGIYDLGGSIVGLRVLNSIKDAFINTNYDFYIVINIFREETDSLDKILAYLNEIESSIDIKITGLINNSNLLEDTIIDDFLSGDKILKEVSYLKEIPIKYGMISNKIKGYLDNFTDYPLITTDRLLKPWQ